MFSTSSRAAGCVATSLRSRVLPASYVCELELHLCLCELDS
jgi:hypothetical protein